MTRLCVSIFAHESEQLRKDVARAIEAGADVIELRVDEYDDIVDLMLLFEQVDFPFIITRRPERQGGESDETDGDRLLVLAAIRAEREETLWVDLEFDSERDADFEELLNEKSILSTHDFKGRPTTLGKTYVEMCKDKSPVVKLAWTARSIRDCVECFQLLDVRAKPTIALCMGEAGQITRILAKKFGAFLGFASLDDASVTAPGQLSISTLKNIYRWDKLKRSTKVFGVVGSPVSHSMSPAIHNAAFEQIDFDGVYVPMLVNPGYESFKAFMESFIEFRAMDLSGLSITIPHKENALRYAIEKGWNIDEVARQIGAVNTFALDGEPRAFSSDYSAILDTITAALSQSSAPTLSEAIRVAGRDDLRGMKVTVLGAGGTGRTAVAALSQCGAIVTVVNRTMERAQALASEFKNVVAIDPANLNEARCDILINTTSVGMTPASDASPVDEASMAIFENQPLVFDTIYNPIQTRLLREAKAAGCQTVSGIEMFVRQASLQFEAWTKSPAPVEVMRKVVESRLST